MRSPIDLDLHGYDDRHCYEISDISGINLRGEVTITIARYKPRTPTPEHAELRLTRDEARRLIEALQDAHR